MSLLNIFRRGSDRSGPAIREIVRSFESLGHNCEFGLVQRYAGFEPLGLFKFSGTDDLERLIQAFDTDFRDYAVDDDLLIETYPSDTLVCRSRRYGFGYTVSDVPPSMSTEALLDREARKIAFLKRLFLEDLASGEKIFVRKSVDAEGPAQIEGLVRALRRHGPSKLLNVRETGDPQAPPAVRWHENGAMAATVPRFSPVERAFALDLEPWLSVCRQAHQLVHGTGWPERRARPNNLLGKELRAAAASKATEHVLNLGEVVGMDDLRLFSAPQMVPDRDPDTVLTFSAWIWIPSGFAGRKIWAVLSSYRLGWCEADLSITDRWQRIWVGAKIPRDVPVVVVGVAANGAEYDRFWSTGWCLEEGPVPAPAQAPSIRIGPGSAT